MKLRLIALLVALVLVPHSANAAPVSWDYSSGILQPLQAYISSIIKGNTFLATSTTATSTFPNLSATSTRIAGPLYDNNNSRGSSGYVLQSSGSGFTWVATSTLGFVSGGGFSATDIDTESELETILTDVTDVFTNNDGTLADDNLTNNQIDDLSDVAALTETTGDLLSWNGSAWIDVATSTLGFLAQAAIDTSAELAAILSDETGTGSVVFSDSPTFTGTALFDVIVGAALEFNNGYFNYSSTTEATIETLFDNSGSLGTNGQVLSSDGANTQWVSTSTLGFLAQAAIDTSAELRSILTDETGTGALMFGITSSMADDIGCAASQIIARNSLDTAWECITSSGGSGGGGMSTTTDNNAETGEVISHITTDFYVGGTASNTAELNLDPESGTLTISSTSASTGYISIGLNGSTTAPNRISSRGLVADGNLWLTGNATATNVHATGTLTVGTLTGLLKATSGVVSAATAGTDYLTTAITSFNGLTNSSQTLATTSANTGWGFGSSGSTHTLNIPTASAGVPLGLLSSTDWTTFNSKQAAITDGDALTFTGATLNFDGGNTPSGELGGTWASPTIDDSLAVTSWNLTTPTLTSFFGTPCTGNTFLQDISDTGAFTCAAASGGGSGSNWSFDTNFGRSVLTPSTTIPVWLKSQIYASSTLQFNSTLISEHPSLKFLDIQSATNTDYTLMRVKAPTISGGSSREATFSLLIDVDGNNSGVNEEFVDFYNERYSDSAQWGLRQAYSGTGVAKPFVLGHWHTTGNKDAGNKLIVLPSGTVAVTQATSTINATSSFYVASSSASSIVKFDATPGTNRFILMSDGKVGIGSSTPADALSMAVGNNAGLSVISSNSGFLEVGKTGATQWRLQNDFTNSDLLEILYNSGTGNAPSNSALAIIGTGANAGNVGIATTAPESRLDVWGLSGGKILTLFSNTGTKFLELTNAGIATLLGYWDFGLASLEIPNSTSLPGTCTTGQIYMDTDATSGQRIYACQSANTWVLQGDGGGSGSPGGSDKQIQINNAGSFGGIASFIWDSVSGRLGLGTTTPYAFFGIQSSTTTVPVFSIATTTGSYSELFSVFGTTSTYSTNKNIWGQFSRAIFGSPVDSAGNVSPTPPFDVTAYGVIRSEGWRSSECQNIGFTSQTTADSGIVCSGGHWWFNEDAAGVMASTSYMLNGAVYHSVQTQGAAANDGIAINGSEALWVNAGTNTPMFDGTFRIASNATSTRYYFGFSNKEPRANTLETHPDAGCFIVASSTQANWTLESRTSTGANFTTADTGIASSSVSNSTATSTGMQRWLIVLSQDRCEAWAQESWNVPFRRVATISTNIPVGRRLINAIWGARATASAGAATNPVSFQWMHLRHDWRTYPMQQ